MESEEILIVFTLRPSTVELKDKIIESFKRNPNIALVSVGTGGGKTYGAIHTFGTLDPNGLLLVLSVNNVTRSKQWERSIDDYNTVMKTNLLYTTYNYEKIILPKYWDEIMRILKFAKHCNRRVYLILDEIHMIALSTKISQRLRKVVELSQHPLIEQNVLGLSATSFSNSYVNAIPYLIMAGYYKNKTQFFDFHEVQYDRFHAPVVTKRVRDENGRPSKELDRNCFRYPDLIDQQLASITVYIDTDHYKPQCITSTYEFQLTPEEDMEYREFHTLYKQGYYEFIAQKRMAEETFLANVATHQKDDAVLGILARRERGEFDQKKAPVLIFYYHTVMFYHLEKLIKTYYPDYTILNLSGISTIKADQLGEPEDPNTIFLVQYTSGGEGLDWQWSNVSIFYEGSISYAKFKQSIGRNVRDVNKMKTVYHFRLVMKDTYDDDRWEAMTYKRDFVDTVNANIHQINHSKGT